MSICRQTAKTDIAQAQKFKITSFIIDNSICSEQFLEEYLDNPENLTQLVLNPFSKGNNIYIDSKNTKHLEIIQLTFEYVLIIYDSWKARRKKDEFSQNQVGKSEKEGFANIEGQIIRTIKVTLTLSKQKLHSTFSLQKTLALKVKIDRQCLDLFPSPYTFHLPLLFLFLRSRRQRRQPVSEALLTSSLLFWSSHRWFHW